MKTSIAFLAVLATSQATKESLTLTSSRALLSSDQLCSDSLLDALELHLGEGMEAMQNDLNILVVILLMMTSLIIPVRALQLLQAWSYK